MGTKVNGSVEVIKIWNGTDAYEPVACLTSNGLSESRETIDSLTKCDYDGGANATKRTSGAYSYELPIEAEYIETENGKYSWIELKSLIRNSTTIYWNIETIHTDATSVNEYGIGELTSLEKTSGVNENITFSASISGSGVVTNTTQVPA